MLFLEQITYTLTKHIIPRTFKTIYLKIRGVFIIKDRLKITLNDLVFSFRHAIENAKTNGEDGCYFRAFPTGQCGTTSDMLAQYFIDNGYRQITYINGTYYGNKIFHGQSHTWLEVDGLVIDITGDQFKYFDEPLKCNIPVYVGPTTAFYQQFKIFSGGAHRHFGLNKSWSNYYDLRKWYDTILQYL